MTTTVDQHIQKIVYGVDSALKYDSQLMFKEAYLQYLRCLQFIAQTLQKDASEFLMSSNTPKCIILAKQCVERLSDTFENSKKQFRTVETKKAFEYGNASLSCDFIPSMSNIDIGIYTPMDLAKIENIKIINAFRRRKTSTDANLSLMRKLTENIEIAKMREETLSKRLIEKRKYLEERATKTLATIPGMTNDEIEMKRIYSDILQFEQEKKWPALLREKLNNQPEDQTFVKEIINKILSSNEHPIILLMKEKQRKISEKIQPLIDKHGHYLASSIIPNLEMQSFNASAKLPTFSINQDDINTDIFDDLFEDEVDDPVTINKLELEAINRHLNDIVFETREGLETLLTIFVLIYQNSLNNDDGRECIYNCIESKYFIPIWNPLITLFRLANYDLENTIVKTMTNMSDVKPSDMDVTNKYQLQNNSNSFQEVTKELIHCCELQNPLSKLNSIVSASKKVLTCIIDYYSSDKNGQDATINIFGADDLIPILVFSVLKSNKPQLISECKALEHFIHESYWMREEAYCLASLQSAVFYLSKLN